MCFFAKNIFYVAKRDFFKRNYYVSGSLVSSYKYTLPHLSRNCNLICLNSTKYLYYPFSQISICYSQLKESLQLMLLLCYLGFTHIFSVLVLISSSTWWYSCMHVTISNLPFIFPVIVLRTKHVHAWCVSSAGTIDVYVALKTSIYFEILLCFVKMHGFGNTRHHWLYIDVTFSQNSLFTWMGEKNAWRHAIVEFQLDPYVIIRPF